MATAYDGSVPAATALMLAACRTLPQLPIERLPLLTSAAQQQQLVGRVVAGPVCVPAPVPTAALAERDGFAVIAAAAPCDRSRPVRTRGRMPAGTDCVVPREWSVLEAQQPPKRAAHNAPLLAARGDVERKDLRVCADVHQRLCAVEARGDDRACGHGRCGRRRERARVNFHSPCAKVTHSSFCCCCLFLCAFLFQLRGVLLVRACGAVCV